MNHPTATIRALCRAVNVGHVGPSSMHRDSNGIPFLMGKNVGFGTITIHDLERVTHDFHRSQPKSQIRGGDVVVVRIGKSGQAAKVPESLGEANCSGLVIIKQPLKIDANFLVYFLNSPVGRANSAAQARGSTRLTLNTASVASTLVPVPPLPEQKRIVGILDDAFEGIAKAKQNAEKNLLNARALFDSHLQEVFLLRGEEWSANRWPLTDLCELIVDCEHKTAPTQEEGLPSIRTPNVGKGKLLLDNVRRVSRKTYAEWTRRAVPVAGDLILAREAPAGNVAVIPENLPLCLGQRTVLIRPKRDIFNPEFLAMYLLQPKMQQKLLAHSRGATVQHVNMKDIRALKLDAIPSLSIQEAIVSKLRSSSAASEQLISLYQRKLSSLDSLKKSLLNAGFSGKLQDCSMFKSKIGAGK